MNTIIKTFYFVLLVFSLPIVKSQVININPDPNGEPWWA